MHHELTLRQQNLLIKAYELGAHLRPLPLTELAAAMGEPILPNMVGYVFDLDHKGVDFARMMQTECLFEQHEVPLANQLMQ